MLSGAVSVSAWGTVFEPHRCTRVKFYSETPMGDSDLSSSRDLPPSTTTVSLPSFASHPCRNNVEPNIHDLLGRWLIRCMLLNSTPHGSFLSRRLVATRTAERMYLVWQHCGFIKGQRCKGELMSGAVTCEAAVNWCAPILSSYDACSSSTKVRTDGPLGECKYSVLLVSLTVTL